MKRIQHINVKEMAMPKRVNPEAEKAIAKANALGFAFNIDQMQRGGSYSYDQQVTEENRLWENVTFSLYKVGGGQWKIVMRPIYVKSKLKELSKVNDYLEMLWFKI